MDRSRESSGAGRTGPQRGRRALLHRVETVQLDLAQVAITLAAFVLLRSVGAVADTPVWIYGVLLVAGGVSSGLARRRWSTDCGARQLHCRVAVHAAITTGVIYATGWGPALGLGYMFLATDNIRQSGSRAARPCVVWSTIGIAIGQLGIAINAAPTFIPTPAVHGLGALAALGLGFAIDIAGETTAKTEHAEADVRRSEQRFRSLVQNGSDIVAVVTPAGEVTYVSPTIEQMGFSPEQFSGHIDRLHLRDVPSASDAWAESIAHPNRAVNVEVRLQRADGSYRWQDVTMTNRCDDPSVEGIVVNFHDVTERKLAEDQLLRVAYHDRLTGLANRARFLQRLDSAVRRAQSKSSTIGLLFLDLDRFKVVNDTYGHNVGDRVLVEVADRLRECVADSRQIGRFGGDEFTILIEDAHAGPIAELAECVTTALLRPVKFNGHDLPLSASVGVVVDRAATSSDDVLRCADLAMYFAKENGRARWELFNPAMGSAMLERYRIAAELRRALEHDELVPYYQPEVSLESGAVVGLEALVRWRHPQRGLLYPAMFIPVAEQNDLIESIDRCVLASACRQLTEFQAARSAVADLFMSVNIAPETLTEPGVDELLAIVSASGVDATKLRLEITERTAVAGEESAIAAIQRLRARGIAVVIDDFGTGYSSLECLQRLPIDGLKIDYGFVSDLDVTPAATAIVQAIVMLARELGLTVTAEGVEKKTQLDRLRALGCDTAQGFYFARALSADAVTDLLVDPSRDATRFAPR